MKLFSKYLILPCVAALMIGACTNLDEDLKGEITEDFSVAGINLGGDTGGGGPLSAAYAELRNAGTANHGSYYSLQEVSSDEMCIAAKGGDWFDGGILVDLHQHKYRPNHDFVKNAWTGTYNAIGTVNDLLKNGNLDATATAQARALRAYFYMRLVDLYGRVKIVTEPGVDAPQATRQEVFNFIEGELLAAIGITAVTANMDLGGSDLPTASSATELNQFGAMGLLAKLYLNAEVYTGTAHWNEAAMAASYVIDNGPYVLCGDGCAVPNLGKRAGVATDPDMLEGYAAVFAPNNDNNPENIFTVFYDEAKGTGMNFHVMGLHYSSQFTWNFANQPWNGYATLEEFYNSYEAGDARKANNFIVGPQLDFGGSAILDYASDDGDLQLNYNPKINELQPNSLREAGARPGKFSFKQLGLENMNNDYPIVRLGDMYLTRAEGLARAAGDWSAALPDVNVVRARAKVAPYTSVSADEFLAERGREMFQESARRTDLIRFGKYNAAWWEKPVDPSAHVNIFPIPTDQINASNGTLTQNTGY